MNCFNRATTSNSEEWGAFKHRNKKRVLKKMTDKKQVGWLSVLISGSATLDEGQTERLVSGHDAMIIY